jgi:arsenite-transporting ATPase
MATIRQRKTLLFSTDPQASRSDILERDIYGKGLVEVLPNLTVVEIDADERVTDYQNEIKQKIKDMYGMDEIPAEIEEYIDSTSAEPAMYESATYDAMPELVASLNPVHSLTSVFGQDLPGGVVKPVQDASGLYAVEVDTRDAVERYRDNIGKRVREFLKWSDVPVDPKPFINIAATNPAFEESAMFDKMVDFMLREGQEYDMVVFDTAAVANAVRLIGLSKIYGPWLARMTQSRREALQMRIQFAFRKEKVMEEVKKDPLMADLISMHERFTQVKTVLVDPETTAFFFVTLPLALPIAVVKRFITMVRSYDIAIGGVIVNEVLRREAVEATQGEEYLTNKYHARAAELPAHHQARPGRAGARLRAPLPAGGGGDGVAGPRGGGPVSIRPEYVAGPVGGFGGADAPSPGSP